MPRFAAVAMLALAPVLAVSVAASAGPKSPGGKSAPPATIKAATAAKMVLVAPASKEFKAATARAGGMQIDPGDLKTPVRMTVRQPSADAFTSLLFVRPEAVVPRGGDGVARLGPSVRGGTASIPTLGIYMLTGEATTELEVPSSVSSIGVVFRASADRGYVVTCTYDGTGHFEASISSKRSGADPVEQYGAAQTQAGNVGAVVLAAPGVRDVTVQFTSDAPWSSSACEITPFG